jgi:hypothetical protein
MAASGEDISMLAFVESGRGSRWLAGRVLLGKRAWLWVLCSRARGGAGRGGRTAGKHTIEDEKANSNLKMYGSSGNGRVVSWCSELHGLRAWSEGSREH